MANERTINVTGYGELHAKPDTVRLTLTVERTDADYAAAVRATEQCCAAVTDALIAAGVGEKHIRALSLADTAEFGILRLIVDQPEKGREVLANEGIVVRLTNVLALSAQDAPGGALGALRVLAESGINVEYMYAYVAKVSGKAIMIVQVEDMEVAEEILRRHGFDEADFAGFGD